MKYILHSFREGETVLKKPEFLPTFSEILEVITNISDNDIKQKHVAKYMEKMSLSYAINDLLRERFAEKNWALESPIFQDEEYTDKKWRLDFAKAPISIEVAFNHGEAIAWNLLKPVLASELNHVKKAIQTHAGVIITATGKLKKAGAFDSAVGEYEKFLRYLPPLSTVLTTPMVIIGLLPPDTFRVEKKKINGRNVGQIIDI